MKCTCGHHRDFHLDGQRRCMVNAAATATSLHLPCECLWFCSRASWLAAQPVRLLAALIGRLAR